MARWVIDGSRLSQMEGHESSFRLTRNLDGIELEEPELAIDDEESLLALPLRE